MSRRNTALVLTTIAALGVGAPVTAQALSSQEAAMPSTGNPLRGTWQVTVDPRPAPDGTNPPPFESTIAYNGGHTVTEATSRGGGSSAGVGSWARTTGSKYEMTFQKYRFDATGAYIGKTVIVEQITVTGASTYESVATTRIIDASGAVVAQFASDATGTRLTP